MMSSAAYKQGKRAFTNGTGMQNPYTPMIKNRYDRKDSLQQAIIRSESEWNKGFTDEQQACNNRAKKHNTNIHQYLKSKNGQRS